MMADEELDAIKAIFSLPGEVRVESSSNCRELSSVNKTTMFSLRPFCFQQQQQH